ncbi:hypothetical protein ES288_A06G052900v1 [Gossypium darwinii]|uniref:Uncharacterized protein n=1 Tax=Gossypium darwinii TaxID=34276 RepID=A0A5D2G5E5_GOSDA|nr:hypothetical protein ES288_A06G052900v1 [Gossypium darwinii]
MIYGKLRGFEEEKKSPLLFFGTEQRTCAGKLVRGVRGGAGVCTGACVAPGGVYGAWRLLRLLRLEDPFCPRVYQS